MIKGFFDSILNAIKGWKKLSAFIAGLLVVILRDVLGIDDTTVQEFVKIVMAYLVGQGIADNGSDRPNEKEIIAVETAISK